jgi:signal transduction histidine kinase
VDQLLAEVRRYSRELRPSVLDHLGLVPAIQELASETAEWHGIEVDTIVEGEVRRVPGEIELGLYRVAQEALRNVCRHAEASRVDLALGFLPETINLTVRDNGKGFNPPERIGDLPRSGRLGLVGIEERVEILGGRLKVESAPGEGTRLRVELEV